VRRPPYALDSSADRRYERRMIEDEQ